MVLKGIGSDVVPTLGKMREQQSGWPDSRAMQASGKCHHDIGSHRADLGIASCHGPLVRGLEYDANPGRMC